MRANASALFALLLMTAALPGCKQNPLMLQGQVESLQSDSTKLAQQRDEYQRKASSLDTDNQELQNTLAQSRQNARILEDELQAMRVQLSSTTTQLARMKEENGAISRQTQALTASAQRRAAATITPNNSLSQQLPEFNLPGVAARFDGDVVRIELPAAALFQPGSAMNNPTAGPLLDRVSVELLRTYPNQIIGVEGHTDTDPPAINSGWHSNHQLSVGRAMAVYDQLVTRCKMNPNQLFVVGHGANHPIASNGTPSGKERNRRVELVVYPDRVGGAK